MSLSDIDALQRQTGLVLSNLQALTTVIEIRDEQSTKLHDLVRMDLQTLRQDHRDLADKLDCIVCVMQDDLRAMKCGAADGARSISDLVLAVQALQVPVAEIVALRSRVAGGILGFGILGSAALWLGEPIYRWFMDHQFLR